MKEAFFSAIFLSLRKPKVCSANSYLYQEDNKGLSTPREALPHVMALDTYQIPLKS